MANIGPPSPCPPPEALERERRPAELPPPNH